MMDWKLKITAVLTAVLMMAVAAAPAVNANAEADEEVPDMPDGMSEDEYGSLAVSAIVLGIVFTAGFILGYLSAGEPGQDKSDKEGAGYQDKINAAMREAYGSNLAYTSDMITALISTVLPQDSDLWFFTTDAWQKAIEYVVAENWSKDNEGYEEYMDDLMMASGLTENAANYIANWNLAIDNAYNGLSTYSQKLGTRDYGKSVVYKMVLGDYDIKQPESPSTDEIMMLDTTQFVKPTSSANRVYLDTSLTTNTQSLDYCKSIYVFGQSNATIIDPDGKAITLSPGANDFVALGLQSGVYTLKTQYTYAGPFVPMGNSDAATVNGGMVVKQKNSLNYLLPTDSGSIMVYDSIGQFVTESETMKLVIDYSEATASSVLVGTTSSGTQVNILKAYDDLIRQISLVVSNTDAAAQALWEIFDACEEKNRYIKPSSLIVQVPGHKLTAAEYKAVYIQAMMQIADYSKEYETELTEISTNVESIGLYCYGDIYYQGKMWAQNVVFTPYISTKGTTLSLGQNQWSGSGFAMIWAQTTDYSSWDGTTSIAKSKLSDLDDGYMLDIRKIVSSGEEVSQVDLTKKVIQKVDIGPTPTPDPVEDEDIKVMDATILMFLIIVELGIILCLIGLLTGSSALTIAGIVVIVFGILWPHVVTSLIMGDFTWGDLLSPLGWL